MKLLYLPDLAQPFFILSSSTKIYSTLFFVHNKLSKSTPVNENKHLIDIIKILNFF